MAKKRRPAGCPTCQRIGKRVREYRELRGLSRAQLGEMAGLSARQIRGIELNENCIRMASLLAVMKPLKMPVEALKPRGRRARR